MTATDDPTPHDLLMPSYQGASELRATTEALERRRVPLVLLNDPLIGKDDPVAEYVCGQYQCDPSGVCVRNGL
jgi:hypothetical protein